MKKDSITLILVLVQILAILLCTLSINGGCSHKNVESSTDTVFVSDTSIVFDTIIFYDTIPTPIYISIPVPELIDSVNDIKLYRDSTKNDDISIYWEDTVQGTLLGKSLSYTLHVPKEIVKTVTIDNSKTITNTIEKSYNKLYLDMLLGTYDKSIGLSFIPKKDKFKVGYNYNFSSNSHNIQIGVRLWHSK